jgi:phage-related protein
VNCTVGANEYLTIDSSAKKVFLTAQDGTITNMFNNRNRDSYVFEKIPTGQNVVSWNGGFGFDIILLEERSEPKWT